MKDITLEDIEATKMMMKALLVKKEADLQEKQNKKEQREYFSTHLTEEQQLQLAAVGLPKPIKLKKDKAIEDLEKEKQLIIELDGLSTADDLRKINGISVMPCLISILKSKSLKGFSSTEFVIQETGSLYHDGILIGCGADVQKKLEHLGYNVYIKSDPRPEHCHNMNVSW